MFPVLIMPISQGVKEREGERRREIGLKTSSSQTLANSKVNKLAGEFEDAPAASWKRKRYVLISKRAIVSKGKC